MIGQWTFRGETGERPIAGSLRFWMEGSDLVGAYISPEGKATRLANLTVVGGQIAFDIVGPLGSWHLVGTFSADRMAGTFQTLTRTISWTAVRQFAPTSTRAPSPSPTAPKR